MRRLLRVGTGLLFLLTLALSALSPVIVHAAGNTCTWTGSGTDNNWSTTANWSGCGGVAPNNTDSLVFPDGASRKTNTNDLTSLSLVEVTVGGNYDISGNALTVTDGMTIDVTAATTHFRPQITFGPHSGGSSSTTVTVINPNDNIAFLDSDIVLATGANNFEVTIDDFTYFTGTISGTTNQFKITSATTPTGYTSSSLGNNHSFTATGGVVLDSVLAWCSGNTCFGNTSNTVTVTGTHANVVATTDSTWENNFICNTNVQCIYTNTMDVDVVMNGDITMQANTIIGTQGDPSMSVTLNGVISGGHNLSLGVGRVTVTGVNTFTGNVSVNGSVTIDKAAALGTGTNSVAIGATRSLTLAGGDYNIPNPISGSGDILISSGTHAFTGDSASFTGTTTQSGGTTSINGDFSGTTLTINGGTLKGSGSVGSTTFTAGTLAPGNSPGVITVNGDLTLAASPSSLDIEIAGPTVGTEYDQTVVTGTANLNSAALNVTLSYTPQGGTVFTILRAGTINGTFSGLANGSTLTVGDVTFTVAYNLSPSGEDTVMLSVPAAPASAPASTSGTLANTGMSIILFQGIALVLVAAAITTWRIGRRNAMSTKAI